MLVCSPVWVGVVGGGAIRLENFLLCKKCSLQTNARGACKGKNEYYCLALTDREKMLTYN